MSYFSRAWPSSQSDQGPPATSVDTASGSQEGFAGPTRATDRDDDFLLIDQPSDIESITTRSDSPSLIEKPGLMESLLDGFLQNESYTCTAHRPRPGGLIVLVLPNQSSQQSNKGEESSTEARPPSEAIQCVEAYLEEYPDVNSFGHGMTFKQALSQSSQCPMAAVTIADGKVKTSLCSLYSKPDREAFQVAFIATPSASDTGPYGPLTRRQLVIGSLRLDFDVDGVLNESRYV